MLETPKSLLMTNIVFTSVISGFCLRKIKPGNSKTSLAFYSLVVIICCSYLQNIQRCMLYLRVLHGSHYK
jgi:hypothetical protein